MVVAEKNDHHDAKQYVRYAVVNLGLVALLLNTSAQHVDVGRRLSWMGNVAFAKISSKVYDAYVNALVVLVKTNHHVGGFEIIHEQVTPRQRLEAPHDFGLHGTPT